MYKVQFFQVYDNGFKLQTNCCKWFSDLLDICAKKMFKFDAIFEYINCSENLKLALVEANIITQEL